MDDALQAGVARVDITPAVGFDWMADFMILQPARGVCGELMARALVLDDGKTQAALVTADLLWFSGEIVAAVRSDVERLTGIPGSHVILNASHTHASAEVDPDYGASREYVVELGKKVAGAIYMAWQARQEVRVGYGTGSCPLSISRWRRTDTGCEWAPAPDSPVDHEVGVLRLDRPAGSPLAVIVNYPAHPSMYNSPQHRCYSAEYPGFMCEVVEQHFGPPTMAMMLMGAGGDVKIKRDTPQGPIFAVADEAETRQAGHDLAVVAIEVAEQATRGRGHDLTLQTLSVSLPLVPPKAAEEYEAEARSIRENPEARAAERYRLQWAETAAEMVRKGTAPTAVDMEVQLLRVGRDIAVFATPGELFNEVGTRIKSALGVPGAFVAAYCNDTPRVGYLPSRRVQEWGWCELDHQLKYFTRPCLPSNFSGEVEDILVQAAQRMMRSSTAVHGVVSDDDGDR